MTIGITIGRAVGRSAATIVHAGAVAATYTGQLGADLATGTVLAYGEHSARLATLRLAALQQRTQSIAIVAKPLPVGARRARATA